MSAEMIAAGLPSQAAEQVEEQQRRLSLRGVAAVSLSMLALAGCGSSGSSSSNAAAHEAAATTAANNACGDNPDFNLYRANTVYGSPEALFPALQHVENGQETLLPLDKAKAAINKQLESDPRVLGVAAAFLLDTRANLQEPNAATLARAEQLTAFYMNNPDQATQTATQLCDMVNNYLVPTDKFVATKGQAFEVQADHEGGQITRIHSEKVQTVELVSGFKLGFNADDPNLTEEQKALFARLENLMVFTGKGTFLVNEFLGQGGFNLSTSTQSKAPAKVIVNKHGQKILVAPGAGFRAPVASNNPSRSNSTAPEGGTGSSGSGKNAPSQQNGNTPENQQNGHQTGPRGSGPSGSGQESKPGTGASPGGGSGGGKTTPTGGGTTSTGGGETTPTGGGTTSTSTTTGGGGETTSTTPTTTTTTTTTTSTESKGQNTVTLP